MRTVSVRCEQAGRDENPKTEKSNCDSPLQKGMHAEILTNDGTAHVESLLGTTNEDKIPTYGVNLEIHNCRIKRALVLKGKIH